MQSSFRRQQWKMLLITMFCYLFFYTGRHNFGWAAKGMANALDVSYTTIGWISFSMLMGYALGQLINGNLADRFSPRIMITAGAYLSVFTNVVISFSSSLYLIMMLWALNGFFQSMAWAPGSKIITNWWHAKARGKAFGFYTMAAGLSSVVTYSLSILLLQWNMEWRMLFRLPVLLLFVAATLFLIIARNKPSDIGLQDHPENRDTHKEGMRSDLMEGYRKVLTHKQFMIASLAFGFESMARYGLIIWVPVHYLGTNWKDHPENLWVTFLLPLGMALGAASFGTLSDTIFRHNRIASIRFGMLSSALVAIGVYLLPVGNIMLAGLLMLLAGFFVYGPQANFWPLSPDMLGSRYTGVGIGFMNMCGYTFAALGEPFFGFIIDRTRDTNSIFIVISIICILSAGIISLIRKRPQLAFS